MLRLRALVLLAGLVVALASSGPIRAEPNVPAVNPQDVQWLFEYVSKQGKPRMNGNEGNLTLTFNAGLKGFCTGEIRIDVPTFGQREVLILHGICGVPVKHLGHQYPRHHFVIHQEITLAAYSDTGEVFPVNVAWLTDGKETYLVDGEAFMQNLDTLFADIVQREKSRIALTKQ